MRPLAVLSLVLLAVGALFFALMTTLGGDKSRGNVIEPAAAVPPSQPGTGVAEPDLAAPAEVPRTTPTEVPRKEIPQLAEDGRAAKGYIRGTVVGPDGAPLERALVSLLQGGTSPEFAEIQAVIQESAPVPKKKATTDDKGHFRFDGLTPGKWSLYVQHELFAAKGAGPIDVPEDGGTDELVTLEFGFGVHGIVRDAENQAPIAGAQVSLVNLVEAYQFPPRAKLNSIDALTNDAGRFQFANIGATEKVLVVKAKGYATEMLPNVSSQMRASGVQDPDVRLRNRIKQMTELDAQPKADLELEVALGPGKKIAGRVLGPDRSGIRNVLILAMSYSGDKGSMGTTTSTDGGEFLIEDLAEGIYTLRADIAGYDCDPLQRVEAGQTDVEILLALQGSILGRVVDDETGRPVSDFTCRVRTLHPTNVTWGGVVQKGNFRDRSNGSFSLSGIKEGEYVVEAFAPGYASSFSDPVHVVQGVETPDVEVRLNRGGTIKGRVIDPYSGQPLAGALVKTNDSNYIDAELMQLFNAMAQSASTKTSVRADEQGEFEIELLTPDRYQVEVDAPGFSPMIINDVNVPVGPATDLGDIRLTKGASITGTVYGPEGETIAGASVVLQPTDTDLWSGRTARTDANGHYTLRNAKPGAYKLYATRPAGVASNPFAGAAEMAQSTREVTVTDGQTYEHDLHLPPRN